MPWQAGSDTPCSSSLTRSSRPWSRGFRVRSDGLKIIYLYSWKSSPPDGRYLSSSSGTYDPNPAIWWSSVSVNGHVVWQALLICPQHAYRSGTINMAIRLWYFQAWNSPDNSFKSHPPATLRKGHESERVPEEGLLLAARMYAFC